MTNNKLHISLLTSIIILLIWSVINPKDYLTWILEALPVLLGIIVVVYYYKKFQFTDIVYILIWAHAAILLIGAHYTFADMPLFNWLRDNFALNRNHYDRLAHFFQGFSPAIIIREILLRKTPLKRGFFLNIIIISVCLALSAFCELVEFAEALKIGDVEKVLETQGDIWDTQMDMLFAGIGAIVSLIFLAEIHNKQLNMKCLRLIR